VGLVAFFFRWRKYRQAEVVFFFGGGIRGGDRDRESISLSDLGVLLLRQLKMQMVSFDMRNDGGNVS